ncbi:MAG TPA: hypothetical protein VN622_15570 [Clostridia bacterium]|nr:hypothetical protein [Clostridia bacterium]
MRFRCLPGLLVLALLPLPCSVAQEDSHLTLDPASPIYRRSAFAHGYIHGYERGFHFGDLDLHMGRDARDVQKIKDFKAAHSHFQSNFGNRNLFDRGYEQGFRVGYLDSRGGREFRAARESRGLVRELAGVTGDPTRPDSNFDQAFFAGYNRGRDVGLNDGRAAANFRPEGATCEAPQQVQQDTANPYCRAFALGYELGYSDGYNNQRPAEREMRTASGR